MLLKISESVLRKSIYDFTKMIQFFSKIVSFVSIFRFQWVIFHDFDYKPEIVKSFGDITGNKELFFEISSTT